jgi:hypothetical protein
MFDSVAKNHNQATTDFVNHEHDGSRNTGTFCDTAGPEEKKHLQFLLERLTDGEIAILVEAVGIHFKEPVADIDRDTLEGVLDEVDRETFYCEYMKIVDRHLVSSGRVDVASWRYAEVCQAYIELVEQRRILFEDAAQRIYEEKPHAVLHPMMDEVADLTNTYLQSEEWCGGNEKDWEKLKRIVEDFLSGNWQTTCWALAGSYIDETRSNGVSFTVTCRDGRLDIESGDQAIGDALAVVIAKLNAQQTPERLLQNMAVVLPEAIGGYGLDGVAIHERVVSGR